MDGHLLLNSASCPVHYCHNESSLLGKWSALSCTDHACRKISSSSSFIIKQKVCCHSQFVSDNPGGGADHAYQVFARRCDRFPQGQSERRVSVDMLRPPSPSTSCSHQRDLMIHKSWCIWTNFEFGLQDFWFCCHKWITRAAPQPHSISKSKQWSFWFWWVFAYLGSFA